MANLRVKVKPRARRDAVVACDDAGLLSVTVTALPDAGKANAAVCRVVAAAVGVPKSAVSLARGGKARIKTLEVKGVDDEELRRRIEVLGLPLSE